jgi:TusA-related sulfurtransferase
MPGEQWDSPASNGYPGVLLEVIDRVCIAEIRGIDQAVQFPRFLPCVAVAKGTSRICEIRPIAIFTRAKFQTSPIYLYLLRYVYWHATCLLAMVKERGMEKRAMGLLDRFFDRRRNPGGRVVKEVDVDGHGRLVLVRSVDCLGGMCPRPQLLTMKVLGEIRVGDVIEVLSDNPAAVEGFPALAMALNCAHLATVRESGFWRIYLRKSE